MAKTRVTLIGELYDCVKPLFDGTLQPEGVELAVTRSPSPEAMRRQLTAWEFDICEMAFGAYLIARAQGADVTAIPVFPRRAFFHTGFACHAQSGIGGAHDLRGLAAKRIGVAEFVQSATLWARGVLERDFGLDARAMAWYVERHGAGSTGVVLGFNPPRDIAVQQTPNGKTLAAMLAAGELDMALVGGDARASGPVHPLFADAVAEGQRYYRTHGYVPANHTYMVSGRLARGHPELVANLYRAFGEAKALAQRQLASGRPAGVIFGNEAMASACAAVGGDPFAYGVEPNRNMLQTVVDLCQEQGLVRDKPALDALFVAGIG